MHSDPDLHWLGLAPTLIVPLSASEALPGCWRSANRSFGARMPLRESSTGHRMRPCDKLTIDEKEIQNLFISTLDIGPVNFP
jgi:hypothetical protein